MLQQGSHVTSRLHDVHAPFLKGTKGQELGLALGLSLQLHQVPSIMHVQHPGAMPGAGEQPWLWCSASYACCTT